MDEVQAAHFFTALDVPYIFTAKSSTKEPHLALGEKGFQVWMARMLLANPKTTSGWLREVVKQMAKQPRTTWPPHTPSRIPKECFKVDLLKHRNARYKFDAAIAAASQAHTGDEEEGQDTEDGDREREALGLAEPARVSEALRLPETTGMHMPESTRAYPAYDGKGYPMNLPKSSPNGQAQQQHQGVQLVPVAQPMQPLAPRWLSGYSGQNASTFEPGRLQQGVLATKSSRDLQAKDANKVSRHADPPIHKLPSGEWISCSWFKLDSADGQTEDDSAEHVWRHGNGHGHGDAR